MIDKQFFTSIHEEYCTQHQIIEDWYKSPTDDEILATFEKNSSNLLTFARAIEELIRTKNEL